MNVKLLMKVKQHILEEPNRLLMSDVYIQGIPGNDFFSDHGNQQKFAKCGTAACIAGWTCLLADPNGEVSMPNAETLLGISERQATRLFLTCEWPERFRLPYSMAKSVKKRAELAGARIDHFAKTKGAA
jgi:hypothetical protein